MGGPYINSSLGFRKCNYSGLSAMSRKILINCNPNTRQVTITWKINLDPAEIKIVGMLFKQRGTNSLRPSGGLLLESIYLTTPQSKIYIESNLDVLSDENQKKACTILLSL